MDIFGQVSEVERGKKGEIRRDEGMIGNYPFHHTVSCRICH
jgi:hypothetical protein